MIAWSQLNPALIALVGRLAGLAPGFRAEHADRPRSLMSVEHKQTLTLQVVNAATLGTDEERAGIDDAGAAYSLVCGQRVLSIRLTCDSEQSTDATWAWATMSRIQTRFARSSTRAALDAVDAALNEVGNAFEANFKHAGRLYSRVILDFKLNAVVNDLETDPIDFIDRVVWTSHVKDADGVELPAPPNVTDETTPPAP